MYTLTGLKIIYIYIYIWLFCNIEKAESIL